MNNMKTCSKCSEVKETSEFYKDITHGDGFSSHCKQCFDNRKKEYYHNNKQYRLACNLRRCVYNVLKGESKSARILSLLDCTPEFLRYWLTSQLKEGQSLKYMEADHIKPYASFDLTDKPK